MPRMKLNTVERTGSNGLWIPCRDGSWRCGNVKVAVGESDRPWDTWYVYVLNRTKWRKVMPAQRPWGYGHPGQAKIGAALMARQKKKRF